MTRRAKLLSVTLAIAAFASGAVNSPLFAEESSGKDHSHKIVIQVGKVTKSQDHPKDGKGHGH